MISKVLKESINKLCSIPKILFINSYRFFIRTRIFYMERIPKDRSAIFAINHITGADPIILLASFRKKIYFLADSRLFGNRFTNFFFRKFTNSIPVFKKEYVRNVESFKEIIKISHNNASKKKKIFFGIFPEGYLNKKEKLDNFFKGSAYLGYKTKLPIIPVYIHNIFKGPSEKNWFGRNGVAEGIIALIINKFKKINIFIGEPIDTTADNIVNEFRDIVNKQNYKNIIENINKKLTDKFLELQKEAQNLFEVKNSADSNIIESMQ